MSQENNVLISKETTKRLIKDIKDIIKSPLDEEGIYYKHDETNILTGYAYICGPPDSMYFGGNYFYKFEFPYDYPHRPPVVSFMNRDGKTRFHPNMYKSGKMCLSILNTWKGDQWTGCQTIRSILLTILSIMDDKPLLHEPGFTESHSDCPKYSQIIKCRNFEFSINDILLNKVKDLSFYTDLFKDNIISQYNKNKSILQSIIESNKSISDKHIKTGIYNLNITTSWNTIYNDFQLIKI